MIEKDLSRIKEHYDKSLEDHGLDSKGVGWPDADLHLLRFDKLLEVIEDKKEAVSINDLGCGYGEMYKYMVEKGFNISHFYGYDISEQMLEKARNYIQADIVSWHLKSSLDTEADYAITSGIFNVRFKDSDAEWEEYMFGILDNMHEFSRKGFSFNVLTSYVDYREDHLYYADPAKFFDHCKRHYSKYVTLIHDYPLWEWTILVKK